MSDKVYVVYRHFYDDLSIVGIYSDQERANKICEELGGQLNNYYTSCRQLDDPTCELIAWVEEFSKNQYGNVCQPDAVYDSISNFIWFGVGKENE